MKCTKKEPLFNRGVSYKFIRLSRSFLFQAMVAMVGWISYPFLATKTIHPIILFISLVVLTVICMLDFSLIVVERRRVNSAGIPDEFHIPYNCLYKLIDGKVYVATKLFWVKTRFGGFDEFKEWEDMKIKITRERLESLKSLPTIKGIA